VIRISEQHASGKLMGLLRPPLDPKRQPFLLSAGTA
jgi:hypothetical protein